MQPSPSLGELGPFTAMSNVLFDRVQPHLSPSAWSVLCVIVRRTRGWHKQYDALSYRQIMAATGIKSTTTIAKALRELLSELTFGTPLLRRQKSGERGASCREANRYALNPGFSLSLARRGERESGEGENGCDNPIETCPGASENEQFSFSFDEGDEVESVTDEVVVDETNAPILISPLWPPASDFWPLEETKNGLLQSDVSPATGALKSGDTKETPNSYELKNKEREDAHTNDSTSTAQNVSPSPDSPSPLLESVCTATQRDFALVSDRMRSQLIVRARRLERAGYAREQIELAAARWPFPTAPHPHQLLDNIGALLNARPTPPHHAKPSNPAGRSDVRAGSARPSNECSGNECSSGQGHQNGTHLNGSHSDRARTTGSANQDRPGERRAAPRAQSRFESSAQRKGRKWAEWVDLLGAAA